MSLILYISFSVPGPMDCPFSLINVILISFQERTKLERIIHMEEERLALLGPSHQKRKIFFTFPSKLCLHCQTLVLKNLIQVLCSMEVFIFLGRINISCLVSHSISYLSSEQNLGDSDNEVRK